MSHLRSTTDEHLFTADQAGLLHAVQQDAQVGAVVWQLPPDAQQLRGDRFRGTVFILDGDGAQLAGIDWDSPTDHSADSALARYGLHRTGPWGTDSYGRRTAPIAAGPDERR